jgi:hypothetical protein
MGKEYITDTVTLEGVKTFNLQAQTESRITQINCQGLEGDQKGLGSTQAFSCQTTIAKASIDPSPITTISIGGFEDSVGANPFTIETANKIKIYTGETPSKNKPLTYSGKERFTIDKRGYVGINNPDIDQDIVTFDVRPATTLSSEPEIPPRLETPSIALTHPYFNQEGSKPPTPKYIGRLQFRSIQSAGTVLNPPAPTDMAAIQVETDGGSDIYQDPTVNLSLYTNTAGREGQADMRKYLEINGYEKKTKIFTQLNLGNVPVFRNQEEAVKEGRLVNGDVYQDTLQNLKIVFLQEEGERARIE